MPEGRLGRGDRRLARGGRKNSFGGDTPLDQLLEMPLMPPEDDFEAISIASLMPSRAKRSIVRMYEGLNPESEKFCSRRFVPLMETG